MSEDLEIKVRADTGEAVANLGKAEKAVAGVTKEVKELDTAGKKNKDGFFGGLSQDLNGITGGFAKFLEATGKVSLILGAAAAAGHAVAAGITAISNALDKQAAIEGAAIDRKIKFEKAMRLVEKGQIALGHSTEEMLANYDRYIAKSSKATIESERRAKALAAEQRAWEDLGKAMAEAGKGVEFTLLSPEDAFGDAGKYAEKLNDILGKAFKSGGAKERDEWAKANEETIARVVAAYEKWGKEVPANVKAAYDALKSTSVDWIAQMQAENAAAEEVYQAKLKRWAAEDAATNRTSKAPDEFKQIQDAAFGAAAAAGELGTNLDRVAEAVVATGGQMVVGAPILISFTAATEADTEALYRNLEARKRVNEEQLKSLDIMKGAQDYLANIEAAYQQHTISLTTLISLLSQFKTQMVQMGATASGPAKSGIEDLIAVVQALIDTAGPRDSFDAGYSGIIQRAFEEAEKNKKK